jgi:hypothetical protein
MISDGIRSDVIVDDSKWFVINCFFNKMYDNLIEFIKIYFKNLIEY